MQPGALIEQGTVTPDGTNTNALLAYFACVHNLENMFRLPSFPRHLQPNVHPSYYTEYIYQSWVSILHSLYVPRNLLVCRKCNSCMCTTLENGEEQAPSES